MGELHLFSPARQRCDPVMRHQARVLALRMEEATRAREWRLFRPRWRRALDIMEADDRVQAAWNALGSTEVKDG